MARTTKEVALDLGLKSRDVTTYIKRYDFLPPMELFDGKPMWEQVHIDAFVSHRREMIAGLRCKTCGQPQPKQPAEVIATDEGPSDAE